MLWLFTVSQAVVRGWISFLAPTRAEAQRVKSCGFTWFSVCYTLLMSSRGVYIWLLISQINMALQITAASSAITKVASHTYLDSLRDVKCSNNHRMRETRLLGDLGFKSYLQDLFSALSAMLIFLLALWYRISVIWSWREWTACLFRHASCQQDLGSASLWCLPFYVVSVFTLPLLTGAPHAPV